MKEIMDLAKGCADMYPLHGVYIFRNQGSLNQLVICDHDFDPIIEVIGPDSDGWHGLALEYHCHEIWKDSEWLVPDIELAFNQLKLGYSVCRDSVNNDKVDKLLSFFESAMNFGNSIDIKYEWGGA